MMDGSKGLPEGGRSLTADAVAGMLKGRVEGDAGVELTGIAPLNQAKSTELGFLAYRRYLKHLNGSEAGAILVSEELAEAASDHPARIVVEDPHRALPGLLAHFYPPTQRRAGIHPTAVLGNGVELGTGTYLGAYVVIDDGARLGNGVEVGAHSVVGANCVVGDDSVLHPHVVLYPDTQVGARVILHSGARLGSDGFGYVPEGEGIRKVPQVGACVVEDDVEIGANTCIDRGSIGKTVVGRFTKLDNLVQIAHNVQIGRGVLMAAMTGVAGSVEVGDGVMTGGQAGISGHLEVGAGARLAAQAGVISDVPAGITLSGFPARDHREYLRGMASVLKLPETLKKIKGLESRLAKLEVSGEG
jgi:UDP-3-O-[3-hydroxymyristoyl] glucosamine N-acyltransferase